MPSSPPLTGVVLLNMGGPDSLSAIRPFLARLFSDREMIRLPLAPLTQPLFAWIVSGVRTRKVKRYYEEIGGGSPIGKLTENQRAALEAALRETGGTFRVYVGMRYWHPLAKHAALEMKEEGVSRAIALPLYPQYCAATTGSSLSDLRRWIRWAGASFPLAEVKSWPDHPGYIAALAETIAETIRGAGPEGTHLLFSAHGIPKSFIDEGDPYQAEVERTVAAVMDAFPGYPHSISYQSRVGRVEWLKPDTVEEVVRLGRQGVERLVVVPVSFVSDHIETLHELDIRLRSTAGEAGIATFLRVPALNDSPAFIRALKEIVLSAVAEDRGKEKA
ncbi:MAG TPA: ferrochelatase [Candidatus Deferrimicrobiaceae bacterium]|nr:ferrochelatase [Candidatus Deferrimicrobiaceae bacterium]